MTSGHEESRCNTRRGHGAIGWRGTCTTTAQDWRLHLHPPSKASTPASSQSPQCGQCTPAVQAGTGSTIVAVQSSASFRAVHVYVLMRSTAASQLPNLPRSQQASQSAVPATSQPHPRQLCSPPASLPLGWCHRIAGSRRRRTAAPCQNQQTWPAPIQVGGVRHARGGGTPNIWQCQELGRNGGGGSIACCQHVASMLVFGHHTKQFARTTPSKLQPPSLLLLCPTTTPAPSAVLPATTHAAPWRGRCADSHWAPVGSGSPPTAQHSAAPARAE